MQCLPTDRSAILGCACATGSWFRNRIPVTRGRLLSNRAFACGCPLWFRPCRAVFVFIQYLSQTHHDVCCMKLHPVCFVLCSFLRCAGSVSRLLQVNGKSAIPLSSLRRCRREVTRPAVISAEPLSVSAGVLKRALRLLLCACAAGVGDRSSQLRPAVHQARQIRCVCGDSACLRRRR